LLDEYNIRLVTVPASQPTHHSGVRLKSNNASTQLGPGADAVAKVCADVEAQVARADERSIDPGQSPVVEGQSIIDKKRPAET